jgi:glycosyltransferase involved in cell wall biosynthesis
MSLYVDLSEFLKNPLRTGIQRIAGELCRYMPTGAAVPVRLVSDRFLALSPLLFNAIGKYFGDDDESCIAEIRRLGAIETGSAVKISNADVVLVPEVFDTAQRIAFFRQMPDEELERYRFIVYDLLPVTHPQFFEQTAILPGYPYFRLIGRVPSCGFISEDTRAAYYGRLKRTTLRGGVVLPLGSDGLGPRGGPPALHRPLNFSVLGTIEPRKNHALILDAFEPLLRQVPGLTLSFIGRMGWVDAEFAHKVRTLASDKSSGLRFFSAPDDVAIRSSIEQSRATIYVSAAEGYGLPPVESLWLGTPVIATTVIPSLKRLDARGIHYVDPLNVLNLRRAVLSFIDDDYANRKTEETRDLNLPTWRSFTEAVLSWCNEGRDSLFAVE